MVEVRGMSAFRGEADVNHFVGELSANSHKRTLPGKRKRRLRRTKQHLDPVTGSSGLLCADPISAIREIRKNGGGCV